MDLSCLKWKELIKGITEGLKTKSIGGSVNCLCVAEKAIPLQKVPTGCSDMNFMFHKLFHENIKIDSIEGSIENPAPFLETIWRSGDIALHTTACFQTGKFDIHGHSVH